MGYAILLSWATATLGLWVASKMLSGVQLTSFTDAVWAGALFGVLHWMLSGPLYLLLGIGTLGIGFLFSFVTRFITSAILLLLTSSISNRLKVQGFGSALVTAFIIAAAGSVVRWLF